jgi:hypothetical protein
VTCATRLARKGDSTWTLPRIRDPESGDTSNGHTLVPVYQSMLLQIARDYPGLPDVRTLSMSDIRFFYDGLRPEIAQLKKT